MAKMIIPDKVCPHCGGNEWFAAKNNGCKDGYSYTCYQKYRIRNKRSCDKWRKSDAGNRVRKKHDRMLRRTLADHYIKRTIQASFKYEGGFIRFSDIPPKMIERHRESIATYRAVYKNDEEALNKINKKFKNRKETKMRGKKLTVEAIQTELPTLVTSPEQTRDEKQAIYVRRSMLKRKLKELTSVADYEALTEGVSVTYPSGYEELMKKIDAFNIESKKLEQFRDSLTKEIAVYNNQIEKLKIQL